MEKLNLKTFLAMAVLIFGMSNSFAQDGEVFIDEEAPIVEESEGGEEAPVVEDESMDYSEEEY